MGKLVLSFVLRFVAVLAASFTAEAVKFVVTSHNLPTTMYKHSAVYDGEDSIYVLGGKRSYYTPYQDKVIKYSIETGKTEVIGTFLNMTGGAAVFHGTDILHFGGYNTNEVYSFSTIHGNFSVVATLPRVSAQHSIAWDSDQKRAYLFGGDSYGNSLYTILRYDANSSQIDEVGRLPELWAEYHRSTAAWDNRRGRAIVFANGTFEFDPVSRILSKLPVDLNTGATCAVVSAEDGQVYILGLHGLGKFDPTSHRFQEFEFDTSFGEQLFLLHSPACAYVPKLNRIYILGGEGTFGYTGAYRARSEISYLELDSGSGKVAVLQICIMLQAAAFILIPLISQF